MDLKGKNLVDWLRRQPKEEFPGRRLYIHRYDQLAEYLVKEVHPHVATGAALVDGIFLNDHGPEHIEAVIQRASEIVASKNCRLTAYEVYLLLASIQVHDIGNIFGRDQHETRPAHVQGRLEALLGEDTIEKRMIFSVAEAHGGSVNGDKDTIIRLQPQPFILGKPVRPRLMAAILRFADELADDRTRAARFAVAHGAVPEAGRVFHKYSEALHSVVVDVQGHAIDLGFEISEIDAKQLFVKGHQRIYLLDEIFARTLKMHRERVYCTRFMRPDISLDDIKVKISVFALPRADTPYGELIDEVGYRLEDRGYPDSHITLHELCPDLNNWHHGRPLTGAALAEKLAARGNMP